jgi:hypothetical protein
MRISAALLVLIVAAPLHAQSAPASPQALPPAPRPASLPVSLVTALFSGSQPVGRGTVYTVGDLPAGWPMELWPPGSAALGGMKDGRMLVAVFSDTTRRPLAGYLAQLRNAGFTQPATRGNGFASSGGPFSWYCRDSATVTARMVPSPAGVSYLRVSYTRGSRPSCSLQDIPLPRRPEVLELPELPPPAGLQSGHAGSSASSNGISAEGELRGTSVTPAALLAHYARLLTAAGWTADVSASDSSSAVQLFRARDAGGRQWHGALSVFATATGRNVALVMNPEDAR